MSVLGIFFELKKKQLMAIKNNALVLFIGLITFSCQEKIVETPCPESKDYGLITVMPESMDFIPKSYKDSEKLVFKNSEGEEIIFYPVNEGVKSVLGLFKKYCYPLISLPYKNHTLA
jgi:hypothetical protein